MAILNIYTDVAGQIGVQPRRVTMLSTDSLVTVTTAGYLNPVNLQGYTIYPTDEIVMWYGYSSNFSPGTFATFLPTISNSVITLALQAATQPGPQIVTSSVTSATPGTVRSLVGAMTETATVMTSGNIVGVRGSVNYVGASGGFIYGTQGKIIATGTLSGSSWNAGVFAQVDVSAATINAGSVSAIWGDWGTTGATATDLTACRGITFTNTTSNVLNAQDYRYGNATYLLELAGAGGTLNYYAAAGTGSGSAGNSTHCAAQQVIKVEINGVAAYIPVFTQNT